MNGKTPMANKLKASLYEYNYLAHIFVIHHPIYYLGMYVQQAGNIADSGSQAIIGSSPSHPDRYLPYIYMARWVHPSFRSSNFTEDLCTHAARFPYTYIVDR